MSTGLIILTASPLNALGSFSIPEGWLLCDGRTYDKNEYLNLYRHLLKNGPNSSFDSNSNPLLYGGDSNTFKVPDLTDKFLRGYKDGEESLQPGKETIEKVNIDGISVEAKSDSEDGIKFGNNTSPYQMTGLASSEGLHSHTYAQKSPQLSYNRLNYFIHDFETQTQYIPDDAVNGFFHRRPPNPGQDLAGTHAMTHAWYQDVPDPQDCGLYDTSTDPPGENRPWMHYSMWSVVQGNYQLTVPKAHILPEESQTDKYYSIMRPDFGIFFKTSNPDQGMWWPHENISRVEQTNPQIRHIHKYQIDEIKEDEGHQHKLQITGESHTHTHQVSNYSDSVQANSTDGQELRPANIRMVYLIYAK